MSKTRVFLGLPASPEVLAQAEQAIAQLRQLAHQVKWVEAIHMHWTLHFLGDLTDQEIYDTCQAAERGATAVDPFPLVAQGIGAFPRHDRPRTLWLGAGEGGTEMIALHAALDEQLQPLGFRGENRPFVPHLTLGRGSRHLQSREVATLAEALPGLADFEGGQQLVDEIVVYASRLRREGPEYQVLSSIPLG